MATNPQNPQAQPAPEDHHFDELSGVYGFFRRHQKKLLYTAGLFTLLTFSITGPMQQLVSEMFGSRQPLPTIKVGGARVSLTTEDYTYGGLLARNQIYGLPAGVMLPISAGEGGESDLSEILAVLRRAAIAEGIEVSMAEVDKAIENAREQASVESPAKLARARGFDSLAQYRGLVAEGMRVGLYIRLQLLALDSGDAAVMKAALREREKITLEAAWFDEQKRQDEMKAASQLSDDDLRAWLDGKNDFEKQRMQVYDLPRAQLRLAALLLAEGQFDPSQWQDGALQDFSVGDDQLRSYYDEEKETRFKDENGEFKSFDDEAVRAELTRIVQAERVMNDLLGKVRQQQLDALKPLTDELTRVQGELQTARQELSKAQQEVMTKEPELTQKREELAEKPEDEALKAAVAELETALAQAKDAVFAAEAVVPAKQDAVDQAQEAQRLAREGFDFQGAVATLVAGKGGFVQKDTPGLLDADDLKDLDALGLELGSWPKASSATGLQNVGDLGIAPGRTSKAMLIYQAIATDARPMKAWDELKPLLEDAYFAEKAKQEGAEVRTKLTDTLLRLAKERMPEFVQEREGARETRIQEALTKWEDGVNADIADAREKLAKPNLGKQATAAYQRKLDGKLAELARKDSQRQRIEFMVDNEIKNEIREEAKKHYVDVFAAAVTEVGLEPQPVGPYPRDLQSRPRFEDKYPDAVVYLFRNHSDLKQGEATDVLYDASSRQSIVAVCKNVEPLAPEDVTRREFVQMQKGFGGSFARLQMILALQHAFSRESIEARYEFERAVGRQDEPTAN